MIECDNTGVLGNVENGGKLPDNELLIFNVLPSMVWVSEEDGGFHCSEGDGPLAVVVHSLVGFGFGATIMPLMTNSMSPSNCVCRVFESVA